MSFAHSTGARAPEEAAAGSGRQVCVGGESVHHCGQLQLLGRGGLAGRSQGPGERRRQSAAAAAAAAVSSLSPAGNLPEALKCFLPQRLLAAGQQGALRDKVPDVVVALWSAGVNVNHLK